MQVAKELLEVLEVEVTKHGELRLQFSDGITKVVNLEHLIQNAPPIFEPLKDDVEFRTASINPVGGVSWGCGADLSADYLRAI